MRSHLPLLVVLVVLIGCQRRAEVPPSAAIAAASDQIETLAPQAWVGFTPCPNSPAGALILREFTHFLIGYNVVAHTPAWAVYALPPPIRFPDGYMRRGGFLADPALPEPRVTSDTYTNSGYSRGHMVPAHVIYERFGIDAANDTFYMTNICPQLQSLNGGSWKRLENAIARAGVPGLNVCVGPIFSNQPAALSRNGAPPFVAIPVAFYVVVWWDTARGGKQVVGAVFQQGDGHIDNLIRQVIPIRDIEHATGLDWHAWMTPGQQDEIELRRNPWLPSSN